MGARKGGAVVISSRVVSVAQVAALRLAGEQRAREAAHALEQGRQQAAEQYAAANRLLSQRTAGEECAAAEAVVDQELGL